MAWRQGQSYSEDLRTRVLAAVDGGMAARGAARGFRVSVSYIYKALIRRRRTGETSARSRRAHRPRKLTGARGRVGGAHHGPTGPHPGCLANLADRGARGAALERGDMVGGCPARAVILKKNTPHAA